MLSIANEIFIKDSQFLFYNLIDYSVNHNFFVFRFETGRVLSTQKPSGIWTHIATMQN